MFDSSQFLLRTLLADKVVTQADIERAQQRVVSHGGTIPDALVALNLVSSRTLAIARAKTCEYPFVDVTHYDIELRNARRIPRAIAERVGAFPLFLGDHIATVAMLDPLDLQALDQVRQALRADVDPVIADAEPLRSLIARAYALARQGDDEASAEVAGPEDDLTRGDEPVVAAVNQILVSAAECGASDVHINPDEGSLHLRYRVDGVLVPQQGPPRAMHAGLVQRLKVMARLDLTQTRKPQDGKFRFMRGLEALDVRLSLLPTIHGENAVMRLLRSGSRIGSVADLGMPPDITAWFEEAIGRPHGMILVTGPTGSGKTTTLYTGLARLNTAERNIMTIEDPVEIRLPLVRQVQVNHEIGLTFAAALRSILRQDPDVVLLGEIRDEETARIAIQAAMTGHLVLSTLHTNDAVGCIARLRDFKVPPFAINQGLLCTLAQRLVRRVCADCAGPEAVTPTMLAELGIDARAGAGLRRGAGCAHCQSTGYRGRIGVYEMFRITSRVQRLIERDSSVQEIQAAANADGMRSIWQDGLVKATQGLTTIDELGKLRTVLNAGEIEGERMAA